MVRKKQVDYQVSNLGRVKSLDRTIVSRRCSTFTKGKILNPKIRARYYSVNLANTGRVSTKSVHRLVMIAFVGEDVNRTQVNHVDGNKLNNRLDNLEWVNSSENIQHYHLNNRKTSKYLGVCYKKENKKFSASANIDKRKYHIGLYETEFEAFQARNNWLNQRK